ncbi:MAG: hypothetical protein ACRC2T_17445 [Thermoguttaceae bacterium]
MYTKSNFDFEEAKMHKRRGISILLLCVATVLVLLCVILCSIDTSPKKRFYVGGKTLPVSATIKLFDNKERQKAIIELNPQQIEELVELIDSGRKTTQCKCSSDGMILFMFEDGREQKFEFLLQHDDLLRSKNLSYYIILERDSLANFLNEIGLSNEE